MPNRNPARSAALLGILLVATATLCPAQPPAPGPASNVVENLAEAPPVLPPGQEFPSRSVPRPAVGGGRQPAIGIGRQAIQAALADQLRAVRCCCRRCAGTNYHAHDGAIQSSFGEIPPGGFAIALRRGRGAGGGFRHGSLPRRASLQPPG